MINGIENLSALISVSVPPPAKPGQETVGFIGIYVRCIVFSISPVMVSLTLYICLVVLQIRFALIQACSKLDFNHHSRNCNIPAINAYLIYKRLTLIESLNLVTRHSFQLTD